MINGRQRAFDDCALASSRHEVFRAFGATWRERCVSKHLLPLGHAGSLPNRKNNTAMRDDAAARRAGDCIDPHVVRRGMRAAAQQKG
jgi:hypothetical protein